MDNQKQETIKDTANTKETRKKNSKSKTRMMLVILFLLIFGVISYIQLRGSYLEYQELGENYIDIFNTNNLYKYTIRAINFVLLYFIIYFTNRGIKKGLKPFFEKEGKEMPKLLNKSLALVISAITSVVVSAVFMQKIMLNLNMTTFGVQDRNFWFRYCIFYISKATYGNNHFVFYSIICRSIYICGLILYHSI